MDAILDEVGIVADMAVQVADKAKDVRNTVRTAEKVKDTASATKKTGSYTIEFQSGKKYHGKGSETRMNQSAKQIEKQYGDTPVKMDYSLAPNQQQAFKDEANRIRNDGGVKNPNNYNKINSPGEKYLKQDGG